MGNIDNLNDDVSESDGGTKTAQRDSMEDYDPNEAANKLFEEKKQQIVDLRNQTSELQSKLNDARKEYEKVAAELDSMSFEDDIEGQ